MKKINSLDTILSPVITEKATGLSELNKVVFKVHEGASKHSIKKNIEKRTWCLCESRYANFVLEYETLFYRKHIWRRKHIESLNGSEKEDKFKLCCVCTYLINIVIFYEI